MRTGADDGSCGLVGRIEEAIGRAYEDESWVSDMRLYEYDQIEERNRIRAEAEALGRAEGLAEGRAAGLAEGEARQAALFAAMSESGLSAKEIVAALSGGNPKDLYREYGVE